MQELKEMKFFRKGFFFGAWFCDANTATCDYVCPIPSCFSSVISLEVFEWKSVPLLSALHWFGSGKERAASWWGPWGEQGWCLEEGSWAVKDATPAADVSYVFLKHTYRWNREQLRSDPACYKCTGDNAGCSWLQQRTCSSACLSDPEDTSSAPQGFSASQSLLRNTCSTMQGS